MPRVKRGYKHGFRASLKQAHKPRFVEPVLREFLSPAEFLELKKTNAGLIKKSRFIRPKLGDGTYGSVEVIYKHPRLREAG